MRYGCRADDTDPLSSFETPKSNSPESLVIMRHFFGGIFWLAVYVALVLAPVLVLLIGPVPEGVGFWWDLSMAVGFAGMGMMGVQFLLTARFRRMTAPYGIDIIYYFHRYLAIIAFFLITAHVVILVVDNPATVGLLNPLHAPWHISAGIAALLLFGVLIVTSLWRRQLGIHYDGWRLWHGILAIAAFLLALWHIEGVGYYVGAPLKRAVWTGATLFWVGLLVYVRLAKPWRMLRRPYRVVDVVEERGSAWTLALRPDGHQGISYLPGQFAWLTFRGSPFRGKEHPFSFSSSPTRPDRLEFTIKELGDFTRTIKHTSPGETVYLDGPYGAFSIDRIKGSGYVFIVGGVGIAPVMSMLRALADRHDKRPLLLLHGASSWDQLIFREAIQELERHLNLRVVHVLEEAPLDYQGETGYFTQEVLERQLPEDYKEYEYFVCGPEPMIQAVEQILYALDVPLTQSHSEIFNLV